MKALLRISIVCKEREPINVDTDQVREEDTHMHVLHTYTA